MGQRHILHCDCNCFYASVEMQEHPELRGKSIAVCGDPEARHGIVLTASYPAKRMGVKTGMPIWEAKQHCRDLIIVPASYGKYQKYSGYVREVFNDYTRWMQCCFHWYQASPYLSKLVNMVPWQKAINIGFTHFCATPARVTALSRWATVYYHSPIWSPRIVMSISSSQRNREKGRSRNDFA